MRKDPQLELNHKGLKCPYCKAVNNTVVGLMREGSQKLQKIRDSYGTDCVTRRYRKCLQCGRNFITCEVYVEQR